MEAEDELLDLIQAIPDSRIAEPLRRLYERVKELEAQQTDFRPE